MKLVEAHFIMRCPKAIDLSHGCPQFEVLNDLFVIPECVTSAIDKMKKQSTGRKCLFIECTVRLINICFEFSRAFF